MSLTEVPLASLDDTERLGARLAERLRPGRHLLLHGDLGAGKSTLARAVLAALGVREDMPSPTFTLVQVYETAIGPVWHVDLYRLEDPEEALELGLEDAFEEAVCLIEWPERLGDVVPTDACRVHLALDGARRSARLVESPA